MNNIIYGLVTNKSIINNENIIKIGKANSLKALKSYLNNTKLIVQLQCDNCDIVYDNLLEYLKTKYTQNGKNYFQGDLKQIEIDIIMFVKYDEITQYIMCEKYV